MRELSKHIREQIHNKNISRRTSRTISLIAGIIVFVTVYTLILPALALEQDVYCGTEAHEHGDDCYEQVLSCDKKEHTHSEDCYDEEGNLTCEKEEHAHGDACYKKTLACNKERHIHTKTCYEKPEAEKETESASTQEKTNSKKKEAQNGEDTSGEKKLDAEDKKKEEQKQEDQKKENNKKEDQNQQKQEPEDTKDSAEAGTMSASDSVYTVTVTYDKTANIPEGSTLRVTEFKKDGKEYDYARNAVLADKKARGEQVDLSSFNMAALDISILNPDGEEIEPEASVQVDIKIKDLPGVEDVRKVADTLAVQHHVEVDDGVVVETVFDGSTEVLSGRLNDASSVRLSGAV